MYRGDTHSIGIETLSSSTVGWGGMQHTELKGPQLPTAAVAVTEIDVGEYYEVL